MGATCVVTPVTGHEEYVEHGENGLVVEWDDVRGTSRALDLLARDRALLHRLRWGALATARGWPSWEQQGTVMAAALREVARRPPLPRRAVRRAAARRAARRDRGARRSWPPSATGCAGGSRRCSRRPRARAPGVRWLAAPARRRAWGAARRRRGAPVSRLRAARAERAGAAACCAARPARRLTPQLVAAQRAPRTSSRRTRPGPSWSAPGRCRSRRRDAARRRAAATSRSSCPSSGAAAAGTRRSPTSCAGSSARGHRCSIWLARPARPLGRRRRRSARSSGRSTPPCTTASPAGAAPTSPSPRAGRPSRRCCCSRGCGARAHLVQDDEPEFYPRLGRAPVGRARPRLRAALRSPPAPGWPSACASAALPATPFDLGIDHAVYRPLPAVAARAGPRPVLRARRDAAARRAARACSRSRSSHRRRPDVEIVLYGDAAPLAAPFPVREARHPRSAARSRAPTPRPRSGSCSR